MKDVKNVSNSSRPFLHFLHVCFFRPLHSFWRACLQAFSKSWDSRMPSAGFASKIHFRRIFQDRASGWSSQSLTEAPTRGVDFSDVKTFHPSLSHPGWPALRCPWMWSVGQVFSEPVQSPNVGMWRCAQLSESRRLMRIRRRLVKKIMEPLWVSHFFENLFFFLIKMEGFLLCCVGGSLTMDTPATDSFKNTINKMYYTWMDIWYMICMWWICMTHESGYPKYTKSRIALNNPQQNWHKIAVTPFQ